MAKNKKKKKGKVVKLPATFSPLSYLKSGKARALPVDKCLVPENWEELQKFPLIIIRRHANGNATFANFFVDLLCTGIKDVIFNVSIPQEDLTDMLHHYESIDVALIECHYELAHNIVYEAVAYAEDLGIDPHPDFSKAELILEPDTDDIPLVDGIPLGLNGRPTLILGPDEARRSYLLAQLKKNVGEGNFDVIDSDGFFPEDEELYDPEDYTLEDWKEVLDEIEDHAGIPFSPEIHYIYEKCLYNPEISRVHVDVMGQLDSKEIEITTEPVSDSRIKASELPKMTEIYGRLVDSKPSKKTLREVEREILSMIEENPDNPVLYNYLHSTYRFAGKRDRAAEILREVEERFPDYFFGKIQRAVQLIEKNRFDGIPEVFDNHFTLPDLFPGREAFHLHEFTSFHTIIGKYYLAKNDLLNSFTYYMVLREMDIPHEMIDIEYLATIDEKIKDEVVNLANDMRNDPKKEKEVLILLTQ